jgi:hypothetical protein
VGSWIWPHCTSKSACCEVVGSDVDNLALLSAELGRMYAILGSVIVVYLSLFHPVIYILMNCMCGIRFVLKEQGFVYAHQICVFR